MGPCGFDPTNELEVPMTRRIAAIVGVVLAIALPASGQTQITTGIIQGTVTDQSGALVPGANVEVRNADTNSSRAQTTNVDGASCLCSSAPAATR